MASTAATAASLALQNQITSISRQRLHHVALKIKHAFNSRHPRTFIRDTLVNRALMDILYKEGFLSSVMPGDERGPFIDILATAQNRSISPADLLTERQKDRLRLANRMREILLKMHSAIGSDGTNTLPLESYQRKSVTEVTAPFLPPNKYIMAGTSGVEAVDGALLNSVTNGYMEKKSVMSDLKVLPSASLVHVPYISKLLSAQDLQYLTWPDDRRLWLDLRYDLQQQPALTDMTMISKGSRRVYADTHQLEEFLGGRSANNWKASEVGAVVIIYDKESGQLMTAQEAAKRGASGEVLCVAK